MSMEADASRTAQNIREGTPGGKPPPEADGGGFDDAAETIAKRSLREARVQLLKIGRIALCE